MAVNIDGNNLKQGVLGLVIALVEVIRDALRIQAIKRIESGGLSEEECERLAEALMDLDSAIEQIKEEQGITESVQAVRDGLDEIVDSVIDKIVNPERWPEEATEEGNGESIFSYNRRGNSVHGYKKLDDFLDEKASS